MPQLLDKKSVEGVAAPATGKRLIADSKQRNLYLRVMPTGAKTFEMRSHAGGRWTIKKLGVWPGMSVDQARLKCAGELGKIDPSADQKRTLLEVANEWHRDLTHKHPIETRRYINRDLLPFHFRDVSSIRTDEMLAMLRDKYHGNKSKDQKAAPSAAIKLLIFTSSIFKYALKRKWVLENPLAGIVPKDFGAKKEKPRDVALTHDEIRLAWAIAKPHGALYRLLLATGQRLSEVQALASHPEQVKGDTWHIDENKSDRPHRVPVLPLMTKLLKEPMAVKKSCAAWHYWCKSIPKRADGTRVTQHDIRHTVASGMKELGVAPHVIETLLNHRIPFLYQSSADMQPLLREALAKWHKQLLKIVAA